MKVGSSGRKAMINGPRNLGPRRNHSLPRIRKNDWMKARASGDLLLDEQEVEGDWEITCTSPKSKETMEQTRVVRVEDSNIMEVVQLILADWI